MCFTFSITAKKRLKLFIVFFFFKDTFWGGRKKGSCSCIAPKHWMQLHFCVSVSIKFLLLFFSGGSDKLRAFLFSFFPQNYVVVVQRCPLHPLDKLAGWEAWADIFNLLWQESLSVAVRKLLLNCACALWLFSSSAWRRTQDTKMRSTAYLPISPLLVERLVFNMGCFLLMCSSYCFSPRDVQGWCDGKHLSAIWG